MKRGITGKLLAKARLVVKVFQGEHKYEKKDELIRFIYKMDAVNR